MTRFVSLGKYVLCSGQKSYLPHLLRYYNSEFVRTVPYKKL